MPRGVLENRKQNVIITLNKLRNFFTSERDAEQAQIGSASNSQTLPKDLALTPRPVSVLSLKETIDYLWNATDSIAARCLVRAVATGKSVLSGIGCCRLDCKFSRRLLLKRFISPILFFFFFLFSFSTI